MIRKVLIVSDSHGKGRNVMDAIRKEKPDMMIHLGDIEDEPGDYRDCLDEVMRERLEDGKENLSETGGLPVPAVFIKGNCDAYYGKELKNAAVFELNGHRFFCTHGHKYGVSYGIMNLVYTAMENDCDIAMYGHTHMPFDDTFGEEDSSVAAVRVLNPGSISLPRGGNQKSYMVMSFGNDGDFEVELKEL